MNYADAVEHLYALGPELVVSASSSNPPTTTRRKFDLDHMRMLCATVGNPQRRFPAILVAGTNGKGSTAAALASILTAAGYRTGLYTSPHLVHVNERIRLARPALKSDDGASFTHAAEELLCLAPISDGDFARLYSQVDDACESLLTAQQLPIRPSFFERLTAVAFLYYAGFEDCPAAEIVVLEVGLGGRLDATNVVEPLLSIITDIALDHQDYLGDTITEIATEKCGILRRRGTLITLPQHPEANHAIGVAATSLEVHAISAAAYLPPSQRNLPAVYRESVGILPGGGTSSQLSATAVGLPRNAYSLNLDDPAEPGWLQIDFPLAGVHQQRNLALAIAAAVRLRDHDGYRITNAEMEEGIRNTRWPGRLEFIAPNLLLDVAHNPAGAWALRGAISALAEARPRTLIFSCLRDKSIVEMSRILFPLFDSSVDGDPLRREDHIILAPISNPRAAAVEDLLAAAHQLGVPAHAAPHLAAALAQARAITPPGGLILATGSVYLVGEIREIALAGEE